jgi:signal peptidase I
VNTDFTAILAVLTLISGAIWGGYALFFARKRSTKTTSDEAAGAIETKRSEPMLVEYARFLFPVFLVVLIVRGFIVEPFKIPSGSMLPTLDVGDYILVNKFAYGLRSPIGYYKLIDLGTPKRGDVIVFRYPEDPSIDYIKRVIGVPGDKIVYRNKQLWINDQKIELKDLHPSTENDRFEELEEILGNVTHRIQLSKDYNYLAQPQEYRVPEGKYFAMGDNRDNSKDSRYWGFVPDANLKGRAFFIWWSWDNGLKWSRVGTLIK